MSELTVSRANYSTISALAEKLSEISRKNGREVDLFDIVEQLGGVIEYGPSSEGLVAYDRDNFTIRIPSITSVRRDRFTIAHELGHYFLHYLPTYEPNHPPRVFHRGDRNRAETQANVFAASLLMPEAAFRECYLRVGGSAALAAREFGVSPDAARVRAEVLAL